MAFFKLQNVHRECIKLAQIYKIEFDWKTDHIHGTPPKSDQPTELEHPPQHQQLMDHNDFLNLNEDCLREILERPEINLLDLAELCDLGSRFKRLAIKLFRRKLPVNKAFFNYVELWRVEKVFRIFGPLMRSIDLSELRTDDGDIVLNLMARYCVRITSLGCSVHYSSTLHALQHLTIQMSNLTIKGKRDVLVELFDSRIWRHYRLRRLHCICEEQIILPRMRFPRLVTVIFSNMVVLPQYAAAFFDLNPQLVIRSQSISPVFFDTDIALYKPNLREFNGYELVMDTDHHDGYLEGLYIYWISVRRLGVTITTADDTKIELILTSLQQTPNYTLTFTFVYGWKESWTNLMCAVTSAITIIIKTNGPASVSDSCLMQLVQHFRNIELMWYNNFPLNGIYNALNNPKNTLKYARFECSLWWEAPQDAPIDAELLNAIDAIWRKKTFKFSIILTMRYDGWENVRDFEVSGLAPSQVLTLFQGSTHSICIFLQFPQQMAMSEIQRRYITYQRWFVIQPEYNGYKRVCCYNTAFQSTTYLNPYYKYRE